MLGTQIIGYIDHNPFSNFSIDGRERPLAIDSDDIPLYHAIRVGSDPCDVEVILSVIFGGGQWDETENVNKRPAEEGTCQEQADGSNRRSFLGNISIMRGVAVGLKWTVRPGGSVSGVGHFGLSVLQSHKHALPGDGRRNQEYVRLS